MPSVYVETTIPSYLTARPSRDLIVAAHQQITHEWWATAADRFKLYVSPTVLEEVRGGNRRFASRRMRIIADLSVLELTDDVERLIGVYGRRLGLVGSAVADIPHFAYAVAYNIDYLVSWNCAHIANGQVIRRLVLLNNELDRSTPVIVTPQELMATLPGDDET